MNAQAAYARGLTGKDVTIAVIDTGIDVDNPEFARRISPDSKSFDVRIARCGTCAPETVSFSLNDSFGHGTATASVAAGAANDVGMHGVAPDATILALKISAADLRGVTATSPISESENADVSNVAPAIRYALDKGAFVISMSLNGTAGGQVALDQRAAMDQVRATDRLLVQSVDNQKGDSFAGTIAENLVGTDLANKDWFLFGIRVNANLQAPAENGVPGALADRTLAVVADNVQVANTDGSFSTVSGNSFAAPGIAGAAALLKQNWPQLGGKAIARILLDTATDLGAPGVDQVYGAGLLNLEKALTAQAPTLGTSAANAVPLAGSSLSFSNLFGGDASSRVASALGTVTVLDKYGRDYRADLSGVATAQAQPVAGIRLAGLLQPMPSLWSPTPINQAGALGFSASNEDRPRRLPQTGRLGLRLSDDSWMTGQVGGSVERSSLATGAMLSPLGIATQGMDLAWVRPRWSIALAATGSRRERGRLAADASYYGVTITTPMGVSVGLASNRERGSALGMRGAGAFGISDGTTSLATLGWTGELGGMRFTGEAMGGMTHVDSQSPVMRFAKPILSSGYRMQADGRAFGGMASFGITSPLRVDRAVMQLMVPEGYDWQQGALITRAQAISLAPEAREMNFELGWSAALSPQSYVRLGVAHALDAGNVRGARDTAAFFTFTTR